MMLRRLLLCTPAFFAFPVAAADVAGWYAGPFAMVGFTQQDDYARNPASAQPISGQTDNYGVSGAGGLWAGYHFGKKNPFAIEFGTSYRFRHDLNFSFNDDTTGNPYGSKSNVQTLDFMVSGLYDLPRYRSITPYVGGGVGLAYYHADSQLDTGAGMFDGGKNSDTNFAWQLQGGVKYALSTTSDLRLDYRYVDMGRVETGTLPTATNDHLSANIASHDVRVGMTWSF